MQEIKTKELLFTLTDDYTSLVNTLFKILKKKEIKILDEMYFSTEDLKTLYGVLTIDRKDHKQTFDSVIVFRTSSNNRRSFEIRNGIYVPFCKNLILPDNMEICALRHKGDFEERFIELFNKSFDEFIFNILESNVIVERLKKTMIKDIDAKAILHDLAISGKIPLSSLPSASFQYFSPREEFKPRNLWTLLNVISLSINHLSFEKRFEKLPEIWNYLEDQS